MSVRETPLIIEGSLDWTNWAISSTKSSYCLGVKILAKTADIVAVPMF